MISVEAFEGNPVKGHSVEIVERKGKGHPDYICDSIMDAISIALCKEYLSVFGTILHHNIDKGLLAAGRVKKQFGGGKVLKPMQLIIGDRATFHLGSKEISVGDIAVFAAKEWFKKNLRFVDPEEDVRYKLVLAEGSEELTDIFFRPGEFRTANDTSAAVGYYPLSPTERVVLDFETHLNSKEFKERFPETGEDIKVMGLRQGMSLDLTVAMPLLSHLVCSEKEYFDRKALIQKEMRIILNRIAIPDFTDIAVHYNTLDQEGRGLGGVYLSLLGTSAEDADSGQVGRGNRVNGLISMNRPMGTEAAAGKNPVSHVGKIYSLLAHKLAKEVYEISDGIKEVYVFLLSRIGNPIDKPQMVTAQVLLEPGRSIKDLAHSAEEIIEKQLRNINDFCFDIAEGKYPIC